MITYDPIGSTALLGTSFETLGSVASATTGTETEIAYLRFHNTSASPVVVTVAIVNAAGTNTDAFWEIGEKTLQANEAWEPLIGAPISLGGTLQAKAGTGSAIAWRGKIRVRTR